MTHKLLFDFLRKILVVSDRISSRSMRILYEGAKNETTFPNYLAVAVIVKNEGPYMYEWLEYHRMLGITKFYVYDNESSDNLKVLLRAYIDAGIVEYKYFPGKLKQLRAYRHALRKARHQTRWVAFIDVDEFIIVKTDKALVGFLKEIEEFPGIEINWVVYGSGGKKYKEEELVIERFKDHSDENFSVNRHVKSIVNPRMVRSVGVHSSKYLNNCNPLDGNGNESSVDFLDRSPTYGLIQINHYFSKSHEEFLDKIKKGRVFVIDDLTQEHFDLHDRNEIKNDPIMDSMIPQLKKRLALLKPINLSSIKKIPTESH